MNYLKICLVLLLSTQLTYCKNNQKPEDPNPLVSTVDTMNVASSTTNDNVQKKDSVAFSKHWYEISNIDGEDVIFVPCDYQNTEFIFEDADGTNKMIEVTGQDGWEDTVDEIITVDRKTTKVSVFRPDHVKITFHVTKISEQLYNWTWEEPDYDGNTNEYSIDMTPEAYKDSYKTVEEPPCME